MLRAAPVPLLVRARRAITDAKKKANSSPAGKSVG